MDNENCEIFDDDEIITLQDEEGNPIKFIEVACVEYEEEYYVLLSPAQEVEGIADDEVIICKLEDQDDETQLIVPVQDEDLMQKVFDEYLKTAGECDCEDCDCEDCDCEDCDCEDCDCEDCDGDCDCDDCHGECEGECDAHHDHCSCGCGDKE